MREADLIIALGARLGEMTTGGYTLLQSPVPLQRLVQARAQAPFTSTEDLALRAQLEPRELRLLALDRVLLLHGLFGSGTHGVMELLISSVPSLLGLSD